MYKNFDDPEDYIHAKPEDLSWCLRLPKLRQKIASANADIVCLQEISKESFVDDFGAVLHQKHGYDFSLNVGSKKSRVDFSMAVLWKASKFECLYEDFRSRATILLLANKLEAAACRKCVGAKRLCLFHSMFVVSVHLDSPAGGKDADATQINQLRSVMKRINFCLSDKLGLAPSAETAAVRIVIVGDFNSGVDCPGSRMLLNRNENVPKHPFLFKEAYLERMRSADYRQRRRRALDPEDPNLRIKEFPTYCIIDRVYCIDLLFFSADTLKLRGVCKTMDDAVASDIEWREKCSQRIDEWLEGGKRTNKKEQFHLADFSEIWAAPNERMPSDHFPIGGLFEFENVCEAHNASNERCRCCLEPAMKSKPKKGKKPKQKKRKKPNTEKKRGSIWSFREIDSF